VTTPIAFPQLPSIYIHPTLMYSTEGHAQLYSIDTIVETWFRGNRVATKNFILALRQRLAFPQGSKRQTLSSHDRPRVLQSQIFTHSELSWKSALSSPNTSISEVLNAAASTAW
jgi:hypothetical protein